MSSLVVARRLLRGCSGIPGGCYGVVDLGSLLVCLLLLCVCFGISGGGDAAALVSLVVASLCVCI